MHSIVIEPLDLSGRRFDTSTPFLPFNDPRLDSLLDHPGIITPHAGQKEQKSTITYKSVPHRADMKGASDRLCEHIWQYVSKMASVDDDGLHFVNLA